MRSFVTLEGIALSADPDDSFNSAPTANDPSSPQILLPALTVHARAFFLLPCRSVPSHGTIRATEAAHAANTGWASVAARCLFQPRRPQSAAYGTAIAKPVALVAPAIAAVARQTSAHVSGGRAKRRGAHTHNVVQSRHTTPSLCFR